MGLLWIMPLSPVWSAGLALVLSFIGTGLARRIARQVGALDLPNDRSSHSVPTPRIGGIAIVLSVVAVFILQPDTRTLPILVPALIIFGVSVLDDVRKLRELPKFIIHVAAGVFFVLSSGDLLTNITVPYAEAIELSFLPAMAMTLFWMVGALNSYNFMDGINGIAAGQAVISGITLFMLFSRVNEAGYGLLALVIAAAAGGFLPWNVPSGSIFMGDGGSATLGFFFAVLILEATMAGISFIAAMLTLFPFLFDTTLTLIRRVVRREQFLSAHRSHYYQRLVATGLSHSFVTLVWVSLAITSSAMGIVYDTRSDAAQLGILVGIVALHLAVVLVIRRREMPGAVSERS